MHPDDLCCLQRTVQTLVKAGGIVETKIKINNPNFEVVGKEPIPSENKKEEDKKVD